MADSIPPPPPSHERLDAEISLLQAMYPDTLTFNTHTREVHYKSTSTSPASAPSTSTSTSTCNASATATLVLRIPSDYPDTGLPELISARDGNKDDVRDKTRRALTTGTSALALEEGVEVLDQIITVFEDVVASSASSSSSSSSDQATSVRGATTSTTNNNNNHHHEDPPGKRQAATAKTVIIWLHHLLATSKRKLAIAPTTTMHMHAGGHESISISGLTKPGYPGIMLFSGPRDLVDAHVQELKALNWQAFQVRYDSDEEQHPAPASSSSSSTSTVASTVEWPFTHERGKIIEVESMADLVRGIAREQDKEAFLRAVGVK